MGTKRSAEKVKEFRILLCGFAVFSIPIIIFGLCSAAIAVFVHISSVYYVDDPYGTTALVCLGIGLASLAITLYAALRRSFYGVLFVPSLVLGICSAMAFQRIATSGSNVNDTNYLLHTMSFIDAWSRKNHRFPANDTEFNDAMISGPAVWRDRVALPMSPYRQRGKLIPYQVVLTPNANGPHTSGISNCPAVVYYSVSQDMQEFWLTMTVLDGHFGSSSKVIRDNWVIHHSLKD